MTNVLARALSPPAFADEEQTRLAGLLHTILWVALGLTLLLILIQRLYTPNPLPRLAFSGLFVLLEVGGLMLVRRGRVRVVGFLFPVALWLMLSILTFYSGGVISSAFVSLTIVVVIAGLLGGRWNGLIFAGLSILTGLAAVYADLNGLLPPALIPTSPTSMAAGLATNFVIAAVLLRLASTSLQRALVQARTEIEVRKQAEEAARASQAKLNLVTSQMPAILWTTDHALRIQSATGSGLAQLSVPEEQYVNKTLYEIFDTRSETAAPIAAHLQALAGHSGSYSLELEGQVFDVRVEPLVDQHGEISGCLSLAMDITDRMRAAETIRANERHFRTLVETIPHGIQESDLEDVITYVNPAHQRMHGYSADELVGRSIPDLFRPAGEQVDFLPELQELIPEQPVPEPFDTRHRTKDGRLIDVQVDWDYRRDELGKVVGLLAVMTDITARQATERALAESEEKYRSLVEGSLQGILIFQTSGIVYANPTAQQILDRDLEQLSSLSFLELQELIHPDDREAALDHIRTRLAGEETVTQYEFRILRHDKGTRWLEIFSSRISYMDEPAILTSFVDISERKKAEERLRRHANQLEALQAASLQLTSSLDLPPTLGAILNHAMELAAGDDAHIFLYDSQRLTFGAARWADERQDQPYAEPRQDGLTYAVARSGEMLVVPEVNIHPLFQDWPWGGAIIGMPLKIEDQVVGVMNLAWEQPHECPDDVLQILQLLGDQAAIAINNARLFQLQKLSAEQLEAIRQLGLELAAELDLEALLQSIVSRAMELVRGNAGGLYLILPDQDVMEWTVAVGNNLAPLGSWMRRGEGLSGKVWESREALIINEYHAWEGRAAKYANLPLDAVIGIPVSWGENLLGVLNVIASSPRTFSQSDAELLSLFAAQAAVAIENARLYTSVREHREQLQAMATRLETVEEAERRRLAQELHDRVGQNLTALSINLSVLGSLVSEQGESGIHHRLDESQKIVGETAEHIRDVMAELRPSVLDDYGLLAALRWFSDLFTTRTGVATTVLGREFKPRLPPAIETSLFRITQEALTNAARHAQAQEITVTIDRQGDQAFLTVRDDGRGFDPASLTLGSLSTGWGLQIMRERAQAIGGRLEVESTPGSGTRIRVLFTVPGDQRRDRP